jgi:hypothetical protein
MLLDLDEAGKSSLKTGLLNVMIQDKCQEQRMQGSDLIAASGTFLCYVAPSSSLLLNAALQPWQTHSFGLPKMFRFAAPLYHHHVRIPSQ